MKNGLGVLVLLALGALGGAFLVPRARAQGDAPPAAPAHRPAPWEYKVFLMDFGEYQEKDDWKEFKEKAGGNEPKADASFRTYVLNYLAKDGWELIQVVQTKEKLGYFYLRRPRIEGALEPPFPQNGEPVPPDPKEFPPDGPHPRRSPNH
jgi:hypothetical protein